jgi:hypothetical protein
VSLINRLINLQYFRRVAIMLQSARLTVYGFGRMLRPEPMNELTAVSPRMADDQKGSPAFIPDCASAASEAPIRLHGNSAPRRAAAKLRADLEAHCGGHPSATQAAIIVQAAELKLRLAVMDQEFIRTGHRSAYASRLFGVEQFAGATAAAAWPAGRP